MHIRAKRLSPARKPRLQSISCINIKLLIYYISNRRNLQSRTAHFLFLHAFTAPNKYKTAAANLFPAPPPFVSFFQTLSRSWFFLHRFAGHH